MVRQFIEGWDLLQILGEGTFGEVKLLVNRATGEACAMKEVDLSKHPQDTFEAVKKEIAVHKLLKHENVVQCYGSRVEDDRQFIFLEYCPGGELFDRIEPELGMSEHLAQNYFNQMIAAVEYLHSRGVAHRDIKPENLLLSESDQLKLSDFGMATVFRHNGKERLLSRRCGTLPYIAPEILLRPTFNAEPADIWSCGVVLVAMLTGELPWDQPTPDQANFIAWKDGNITKGLWKRVESLPLSLVRKVLTVQPSRRYTIENIKNHLWCKKKFKDSEGNLLEPELVAPPLKRGAPESFGHGGEYNYSSQPADVFKAKAAQSLRPHVSDSDHSTEANAKDAMLAHFGGFSQPAHLSEFYSGTQASTQTQTNQTAYQRLVKRMTRFWVDTTFEKTEIHLKGILQKSGYTVTSKTKGIYTIETKDKRGAQLIFKCTFIQVEQKFLLDFRLSRGCGLEFKRHFASIKANCKAILDKAPILWPNLIPLDAIPGVPK